MEKLWEVSDIYKYIVQEVFLTNKTYSNYNEVLGLIKGAVKKTLKEGEKPLANILSILDDAKESISKPA